MTPKETKKQEGILTTAHEDYEKGLNSYAYFKTNNHNTGEDLVQDTFMKTWQYLAKGGKIDMMKAFLYHVLNNLIVDQYRKHKTTSLDILLKKGFEPSVDYFAKILNDMDSKAAVLLVEQLPEKYRNVILMRYIQDLSLKEIADITGESKSTVAVHIHRGIAYLKVIYQAQK